MRKYLRFEVRITSRGAHFFDWSMKRYSIQLTNRYSNATGKFASGMYSESSRVESNRAEQSRANSTVITTVRLLITKEGEGHVKHGGGRCGRESDVSIFLP